MKSELIIAIIEAVIKHGPTAVITIAAAMENEEVTADRIKTLFITKDPEEYFENPGE